MRAMQALQEKLERARRRLGVDEFSVDEVGLAATVIRSGDRPVGLLSAGAIAPLDKSASDVHVLTKAQRSLVLGSLSRIAAAVAERRTP